MQKIIKVFFASIFLLVLFPAQIFALENQTNINTLIENAKLYDNKTVTVRGEAIGEPMERKEYCWINIHDGTNAIGIWIKLEDAKLVKSYGNYKNKGDKIEVTGVFYRACPMHGGEADIHSIEMKIIDKGHLIKEEISQSKLIIAILLIVTLLTLIFLIHKYKIIKLPYHL